uniref:Chromo domain-containing protein n=1 Tax=Romanomermis culicivorax TaxID=13658 RepID=A0A915HIZ6_ROMCU
MQKIEVNVEDLQIIGKILKIRKEGKKIDYLVRWGEYPSKFNSSVPELKNSGNELKKLRKELKKLGQVEKAEQHLKKVGHELIKLNNHLQQFWLQIDLALRKQTFSKIHYLLCIVASTLALDYSVIDCIDGTNIRSQRPPLNEHETLWIIYEWKLIGSKGKSNNYNYHLLNHQIVLIWTCFMVDQATISNYGLIVSIETPKQTTGMIKEND